MYMCDIYPYQNKEWISFLSIWNCSCNHSWCLQPPSSMYSVPVGFQLLSILHLVKWCTPLFLDGPLPKLEFYNPLLNKIAGSTNSLENFRSADCLIFLLLWWNSMTKYTYTRNCLFKVFSYRGLELMMVEQRHGGRNSLDLTSWYSSQRLGGRER